MKTVLLTADQPRQMFISHVISRHCDLAEVVVERKSESLIRFTNFVSSVNYSTPALFKKICSKFRLRHLDNRYYAAESKLLLEEAGDIGFPDCPLRYVTDINHADTVRHIGSLDPDLIVVSGTSLIKEPIFNIEPKYGLINLHAGLSPYYRGGPCTFWALFNEEPEYIGVTIHWLSLGIDSGNIISSERIRDIKENDNEATLDMKVFRAGARLIGNALDCLSEGASLPSIEQWEQGTVFYYRYFTAEARLDLEQRLQLGLLRRLITERGLQASQVTEFPIGD